MINRIEPGYLRPQDSLSKRKRRERRRRVPRDEHSEPAEEYPGGPPRLEEERVSATLDLVA